MKILNKKLSPEHFIEYIDKLQIPFWRKIDKLVFHHTSSPVEIWRGSASILHYYNLYKSRGWKTGPHIFIAPDGIWLFTPIGKQGTHAGEEGNKNSIGIEVVGRYFSEAPSEDTLCKYIALVTKTLMDKYGLGWHQIFNHNDFSSTHFCSPHITSGWLHSNAAIHADYVMMKQADTAALREAKQ